MPVTTLGWQGVSAMVLGWRVVPAMELVARRECEGGGWRGVGEESRA